MTAPEAWLEALPELMAGLAIKPRGVLHLGAGDGREVPHYRRLGFRRLVLVEPLPYRALDLRRLPGGLDDPHGPTVIEAAVADTHGETMLHVPAHDEAASILRPLRWEVAATVAVQTITLDELARNGTLDGLNVLVADIQGAEVEALSSGPLDRFELCIVEATAEARYQDGATRADVDQLFTRLGWVPLASFPHHVEPWVVDTAYTPPRAP